MRHLADYIAGERLGYLVADCTGSFNFIVKHVFLSVAHSLKDPHFEDGLFLVCAINNHHNHPVHCADSVHYRDVADETRKEITRLLESGHSPLYYKLFKKAYGQPCGQAMMQDLSRNVNKYNEEFGEECIKLAFHNEQPVVAFCTPLMKRVHQLWRYSSEMAFIDSSVVAFCTPLMKRVHQLWRYSSEMAFIDSSVVAFCTPLMKRVHQLWRYNSEMHSLIHLLWPSVHHS